MTDNLEHTIEILEAKIRYLESELEELASDVAKANQIKNACRDMGQKLAEKFGEPLADWWWVH